VNKIIRDLLQPIPKTLEEAEQNLLINLLKTLAAKPHSNRSERKRIESQA